MSHDTSLMFSRQRKRFTNTGVTIVGHLLHLARVDRLLPRAGPVRGRPRDRVAHSHPHARIQVRR